MNLLIILDISNKHKRRYVAFGTTVNDVDHIIASDNKGKLLCFLEDNRSVYENFSIFDRSGKLIEAYIFNTGHTALNCTKTLPYIKIT